MFEEFGINAGYVEELHAAYMLSPHAVEPKWRSFFEANEAGARALASSGDAGVSGDAFDSVAVLRLADAYRNHAHKRAHINPIYERVVVVAELDPSNYGLDINSTRDVPTVGIAGLSARATVADIVGQLEKVYASHVGAECGLIDNPKERAWLCERLEASGGAFALRREDAFRALERLTEAEGLEQFIAKNFVGAKRFSCEGSEAFLVYLDSTIEAAGAHGVSEVVIGMAHRGRLNVLVNTMGKSAKDLFAAFDDKTPDAWLGTGDVKYHLGYSKDRHTTSGNDVHLTLAFNPSHLEFVAPVVTGRARAKQDREKGREVIPVVIHGDAAVIGQGVVPETLNMARLPGYDVGGTIHIVVNNQVGFTTFPEDSRSTSYCTDVFRMLGMPVLHVNADDPDAVVFVARLAVEYRQLFKKDIAVDLVGFRKYGHNEGDEPRFTQPRMYAIIDKHPGVRGLYADALLARGQVAAGKADEMVAEVKARFDAALAEARAQTPVAVYPSSLGGVWKGYQGGPESAEPGFDTTVPADKLLGMLDAMSKLPEDFHVHPKVKANTLDARRDKAHANPSTLDWGAAEHLAFASLLTEGARVRITGQDARRGTFSHRHAVITDTENGNRYTPLEHLSESQAKVSVFDSPLSETGVLGFEYGYSLDTPDGLTIWEAQFGDFANGAQVIIDQFLAAAEDKWQRLSGLVLLLPHGYEGQGPEHSSARIERFLSLAARDNLRIVNLTTPAQIFHALRRQVKSALRKPLVVFTPKSLLRHPMAISSIDDLATGRFQHVITDTTVDPKTAKKVLLCTGRVYYDLVEERTKRGANDVAIVRLEQLYPLGSAIVDALAPYAKGTPLVWVQDEPRNTGAWYFLHANLHEHIGDRLPLSVVSRPAAASPATGSNAAHKVEQRMLLDAAFE